jgi:hypothetical protein
VCTPAPLSGCLQPVIPAKASLTIANKTPDLKDKLQWKWIAGAATTLGDFGTPLTSTHYLLCIYDGGSQTLVARGLAPAGGTCLGKPCWAAKSKGFQYKDKGLTPDGIAKITLKAGLAGKAKIILKAQGDNVDMPPLPLAQPVRVQLRNSDGTCWEATYSAPAKKNQADAFKDKAD